MSMMTIAADEVLTVKRGIDDFLFIDKHSRDAVVSANTFLAILRDQTQDAITKDRMDRLIFTLSDMLYGDAPE